jgi:ubiquinone/menaquinone biosynthesis C-methylase UbiE
VEFVVADSEEIPFADGEFSAVTCTTSIHHYPHPEKSVQEMARVLAPGGRIAIGDANPEHLVVRAIDRRYRRREPGHLGFHSPEELTGFLTGAGLTSVTLHRLHRQGFVIALARKR